MKNYQERALIIQERINELTANHLQSQLFGSQDFIEKSQKIASWMEEIGLETKVDNIGNLKGIFKSNIPFINLSLIQNILSHYKNKCPG